MHVRDLSRPAVDLDLDFDYVCTSFIQNQTLGGDL